jgi:hypothetical protein
MLAKVIKLTHEKGGQVSSRNAVDYLARASAELAPNQAIEGGTFGMEGLPLDRPDDRTLAVQIMDHTAAAGRQRTHFKNNPFYHFVLSWRDGEHPTKQQCEHAAQHALKALGLAHNQAVWLVHRDTAHHHVHVVANRVDPDKLVLSGPPRYDYLVLDRACREIELMQSWQHDHGPHAVMDGVVTRISNTARRKLGLLPESSSHAPTPASRMAEVHSGAPSFADWMRERVAPELAAAISQPNASWQDLHATLAQRGIAIQQQGGGLVFITPTDTGRDTRTKASGMDYRFSMGRLQKALGAFQPDTTPLPVPEPDKTYARFAHSVRAGQEPGEYPGKTGNATQREERRQAREQAREALAERFKAEKAAIRQNAQAMRIETHQRHITEKAALLNRIKAGKPERMAALTEQHGSRQLARSLYAAEKVAALQDLQTRHQAERAALAKSVRMEWPAWVEQQAAAGNEAAQSALRGMRYREQRKKTHSRPGFEGEDLDGTLTQRQPDDEDKAVGSIGGEGLPFRLSTAAVQIDYARQRITYMDEHGQARLTDSGPRIDVHQTDFDTISQGLLLAAQKFGGEVYITGAADFRERAARQAARMGIRVADQDLQGGVEQARERTRSGNYSDCAKRPSSTETAITARWVGVR